MSGSRASFRAAAEQGDPPGPHERMLKAFNSWYQAHRGNIDVLGANLWTRRAFEAGAAWARSQPDGCARPCCWEQQEMDLRGEGGA